MTAPHGAHDVGVDLAWALGTPTRAPRESGWAVLDASGAVADAGWAVGLDDLVDRLAPWIAPGTVLAIDAPLVVPNATGMRGCEREVARTYATAGFGAYPSNTVLSAALGGVRLLERLEAFGVAYADGTAPSPVDGAVAFECYPSTTIVGAPELDYATKPRYKKLLTGLPRESRRAYRAAEITELATRLGRLADAAPPLDLRSHPATASLVDEPWPHDERGHKHREDLLDAVIAAWTAALWRRHVGTDRIRVFGRDETPDARGRVPTIVSPVRPRASGV